MYALLAIYVGNGVVKMAARFVRLPRCGMNIGRFYLLIETLRKKAIGEPVWLDESQVFEYSEHSAKVVAVLKLTRAAHGVTAIHVLWRAGLFIDFGTIIRCINDCTEEIYFLLEEYPNTSGNVDRFVKAFFESTIDGYLSSETVAVERKKIRAAVVRVLKGRHDDATQKLMERIYKAFCGYVHANYAQIMEVYNGACDDFNLAGVPSRAQQEKQKAYLDVMRNSVLLAGAYIAQALGFDNLRSEIVGALDE